MFHLTLLNTKVIQSYQILKKKANSFQVMISPKTKVLYIKAKQCQMDLAEIKSQTYFFSFIFNVPFPRSMTLVKHLLKSAFDLNPLLGLKKKSILKFFFQTQSLYCVLRFWQCVSKQDSLIYVIEDWLNETIIFCVTDKHQKEAFFRSY